MFGSRLDVERVFGQDIHMQRTYVRRRLAAGATVLVLGMLGILAMTRGAEAGVGVRPVVEHRYVVRPGDTLWGIATNLAPDRDPRVVVAQIVDANGVEPGGIQPGQVLVIPPSA
jgi:nucleoid-associated protein YgaU